MIDTTANPYNQILRDRAAASAKAHRFPISPGCKIETPKPPSIQQQRGAMLDVLIDCSTAGDNLLIPSQIGKKLIYEIVLWNVAEQTLTLYQGPSATGIRKLRLTSLPAKTGWILGFPGNETQCHFEIESGSAFVLNLSNSTQVDGMIRYKNSIGSEY